MFTALSLIQLMTAPLSSLFQNIPALFGGAACCKRIETYLLARPRHDPRTFTHHKGDASRTTTAAEKIESAQVSIVKSAQKGMRDTPIVTINDGCFGWESIDGSDASRWTLEKVNSVIYQGDLVVITGPVASGKSTLLKGLLGETSRASGVRFTSEPDVAYCDQTVWLQNTTVKDNIVAHSSFDGEWYSKVTYAAALDADLESWAEGDKTLVGSNGTALSGGQKRRIVSS